MKTSSRTISILIPIALALILAVSFVAATPQGRALAQDFLSLFSRTENDQQLTNSADAIPSAITPAAGKTEAEGLTGWEVFQPSWLPEGFALKNIDYRPQSDMVVQEYLYEHAIGMQAGYFYLGQRKTPFNDLWKVGESAQIEKVLIGDVTGEYVVGLWGGEEDHPVWEANPNIQHLRWQANGYYFDLEFRVVGVDAADLANSPYYLSKEKLVAIASSMK